MLEKKCLLLTRGSSKITTLKTNNYNNKQVNVYTIRSGLSLFVIVDVVVISCT